MSDSSCLILETLTIHLYEWAVLTAQADHKLDKGCNELLTFHFSRLMKMDLKGDTIKTHDLSALLHDVDWNPMCQNITWTIELNLKFSAWRCVEPWGLNRAVARLPDLCNHVCQVWADIKMLSTRVNTAPFIGKCHFRFSPTCELACREHFIIAARLRWASPPKQSRQMSRLYLQLLEGFHGVSLD